MYMDYMQDLYITFYKNKSFPFYQISFPIFLNALLPNSTDIINMIVALNPWMSSKNFIYITQY